MSGRLHEKRVVGTLASMRNGDVMDLHCRIAWMRATALVVVLAALGFAAWRFGWGDYLIGVEGIQRLRSLAGDSLPSAIALYFIAVAVGGVLLALPGALFALAAGILFGPWLGTACCVLAATVAAVLSFLVGRFFLKDLVKPLAMRNGHLRRWLFEGADGNAVLVLLVTRMVPVFPYNLQNFAYGATDVKLSTYTWCTLVFMIPGTALYTFAAAGVIDEGMRTVYLGVAIALALAVALVGIALRRRFGIGRTA